MHQKDFSNELSNHLIVFNYTTHHQLFLIKYAKRLNQLAFHKQDNSKYAIY